jgi:type IV pilus assembly protein PilF
LKYAKLFFSVLVVLVLAGCQSNPEYSSNGKKEIKLETNKYINSPANLYIKLAQAYYAQGDMEIALGHAQNAVAKDSGNPNAHNILALIYQSLGQTSKAEAGFKKALSISPNNPHINNAYGSLMCHQGKLDKALIHYNKTVDHPLYERKWIPLANAGICALRHDNLEVAEEYLRKSLQNNEKFRFSLYNMVKLSVLQENYLMARAFLQRYLEVGPHDSKTLWWGVLSEQHQGDRDTLESYKLQLRARFPDSDEAKLLFEMENNQK